MSIRTMAALLMIALPVAAHAQAAREGNVYNGVDHQPTAGVAAQERQAGVAPSPGQVQSEDRTLDRLNGQLLNKAHQDAQKNPQSVGNPYGVQPGKVVPISPDEGAGGSGAGGSGDGGSGDGGSGNGGG